MRYIAAFILILIFAGLAEAAYDNSAKTVIMGGRGIGTYADYCGWGMNKFFIVDTKHKITCAGTATSVTYRTYRDAGATVAKAYLYLVTATDATHYVVNNAKRIDITADIAAGYNTTTKTISMAVTAGLVPAIYVETSGGWAGMAAVTNANLGLGLAYVNLGAGGSEPANGATVTTDSTAVQGMFVQFTMTTSNHILVSDSTGYAKDTRVQVPAYTTEPYYICIEDFYVPDGENGVINLIESNAAGGDQIMASYELNYIAGNASRYYLRALSSAGAETFSFYIGSGIEEHKWNLHIRIDPVRGKTTAFAVDYYQANFRHINLTNRTDQALGGTASAVRRISLTQGTGTGATIGKITVCRKPVVIVGDSYTSDSSGGKVILARVGAVIGAAFTEDRYVIQAGLYGNKLLSDAMSSAVDAATAIKNRWNGRGCKVLYSDGKTYLCTMDHKSGDSANYNPGSTTSPKWSQINGLPSAMTWESGKVYHGFTGDICAYKNVVFVLVNGPCTNDSVSWAAAASTAASFQQRLAGRFAQAISQMATDVYMNEDTYSFTATNSAQSDIVLSTMIPLESTYTNNATIAGIQQYFKTSINSAAAALNVPVADLSSYGYGYEETNGQGLHPNEAGCAWIAGELVRAYEGNTIPRTSSLPVFRNQPF